MNVRSILVINSFNFFPVYIQNLYVHNHNYEYVLVIVNVVNMVSDEYLCKYYRYSTIFTYIVFISHTTSFGIISITFFRTIKMIFTITKYIRGLLLNFLIILTHWTKS